MSDTPALEAVSLALSDEMKSLRDTIVRLFSGEAGMQRGLLDHKWTCVKEETGSDGITIRLKLEMPGQIVSRSADISKMKLAIAIDPLFLIYRHEEHLLEQLYIDGLRHAAQTVHVSVAGKFVPVGTLVSSQ